LITAAETFDGLVLTVAGTFDGLVRDTGTVSSSTMRLAAEVVCRKSSLCEAAAKFDIAKTTLFQCVKKLKTAEDVLSVTFTPNYKVRQVFTAKKEAMLLEYRLTASKLHHGLSPKQLRLLA